MERTIHYHQTPTTSTIVILEQEVWLYIYVNDLANNSKQTKRSNTYIGFQAQPSSEDRDPSLSAKVLSSIVINERIIVVKKEEKEEEKNPLIEYYYQGR